MCYSKGRRAEERFWIWGQGCPVHPCHWGISVYHVALRFKYMCNLRSNINLPSLRFFTSVEVFVLCAVSILLTSLVPFWFLALYMAAPISVHYVKARISRFCVLECNSLCFSYDISGTYECTNISICDFFPLILLSDDRSSWWQVKLVKCLVQNIVVDISVNQIGGLCTLCFLEKVIIQKLLRCFRCLFLKPQIWYS